jgi:glycosyltransferase involved in cell wall biosynthesis
VYDVCIGASHIHDKKGQWQVIKAIAFYEEMFAKKLKCVMPGRITRGVHTNNILPDIEKYDLDVRLPGMIERTKVNEIYNISKLFVHMGGGGQNDRGPLEALRCGVPVLISNKRRHHRIVYQNPKASLIAMNSNDPRDIALDINNMLTYWKNNYQETISQYYEENNGVETVILPRFKKLFSVIRENPTPNIEAMRKEFSL